MGVSGFDWDEGNRLKCQKHGVGLDEIEGLFARPVAVRPDPLHSKSEQRFQAIGRTPTRRYVFLVFTLRSRAGERLIRPISARYMHRREVAHYEQDNPRLLQ